MNDKTATMRLLRNPAGVRGGAFTSIKSVLVVLVASCLAGLSAANVLSPDQESVATPDRAVPTDRPHDFFIHLPDYSGESSKYLTFGFLGWAGGIIHWRYDDTNRPSGIIASSAQAVTRIQTSMNKWTAVCNVQFIYDGTSSAGPSRAPPTNSSDGLNVVGWRAQGTGGQTGVAGVAASGPGPGGPFTIVEGDIALNYQFNPDVDTTILHEVGHMIGIDHSDVSNAVMSGPPLTAYSGQTNLQADDIAACVALYGPPVAAPMISGAITNGGGVAGVTFCARPSAGVTCTASNGSGAYSCTVPSGWTGTLHSPIVSGNRIPAQVFSTGVTGATTRNVTAKTHASFSCNLDVDNNGLFEPTIDGVAILRRMHGFGQNTMTGLSGTCAQTTSASALFTAANPTNFNVTGGAAVRPATDGAVLLRAMRGLVGAGVESGLGLGGESGATRTIWGTGSDGQIRAWLNSTCGTDF